MTKITDNLYDIASIDGLRRGFISGLVVTPNSGSPTTHIDISVGAASDTTRTYVLELTSAFTKDLSATFAAGTGNGGYYTSGGLPVSSTIYVYIIRKDSDGSIDVYADTSSSAANIPAGYTVYNEISRFITDGSGNIINFTASEIAGGIVIVEYKAVIAELSAAATDTTRHLLAISAPPSSIGLLSVRLQYATANVNGWCKSSSYTDAAPDNTNSDILATSSAPIEVIAKEIVLDSSKQIAYRASAAGGTWYINTKGYILRRNI